MPVTAARARGRRNLLTQTEPRPSRGCLGEDGRVSTPVRSGGVEPVGYGDQLLEQVTRGWAPDGTPAVGVQEPDAIRGEPMNHGCARTWVRDRRAAVLSALTLLAVCCGSAGLPVDTTASPTTTAMTTAAVASASTSVSLPGLLVTDPKSSRCAGHPSVPTCCCRSAPVSSTTNSQTTSTAGTPSSPTADRQALAA